MTDTTQNLPADTERFAKFHPADKLEEMPVKCTDIDVRSSAQIATEGRLDTPNWFAGNQQIPG